jgi:threonyl-tRNA synthetase
MLVVGDDEESAHTLSIRPRHGDQQRGVSVDEFVERIVREIEEKVVET